MAAFAQGDRRRLFACRLGHLGARRSARCVYGAAAQGSASGTLIGAGAAYLQRRFDSTEPIDIDVKRLRTLDAPGCGRIEVTTRQRGALVNGRRQPQELVYQLSFCADGRFPEEQ